MTIDPKSADLDPDIRYMLPKMSEADKECCLSLWNKGDKFLRKVPATSVELELVELRRVKRGDVYLGGFQLSPWGQKMGEHLFVEKYGKVYV
jgi:hypothetical protein